MRDGVVRAVEIEPADFSDTRRDQHVRRVAREARAEGHYRRRYEVVSLASLATQQQAYEPTALGVFQRWQDPQWKRLTVSLR